MQKYLIGSFAAATLVLGACGGSGSGSGSGGGGNQSKVADMTMAASAEAGVELDRSCVEEKAAKLSNADAKTLVETNLDGDAALSPEGEALGTEIFSCVDIDSFVDSVIAQLPNDGSLDVDCVKEKLDGVQTADEVSERMVDLAISCADLGG